MIRVQTELMSWLFFFLSISEDIVTLVPGLEGLSQSEQQFKVCDQNWMLY